MSQNKPNSGVLFRNTRKKFVYPSNDKNAPAVPLDADHAKKPDYTGNVTVNGVDYWIAAWTKESESQGQKYFSLSFTPKTSAGQREAK